MEEVVRFRGPVSVVVWANGVVAWWRSEKEAAVSEVMMRGSEESGVGWIGGKITGLLEWEH